MNQNCNAIRRDKKYLGQYTLCSLRMSKFNCLIKRVRRTRPEIFVIYFQTTIFSGFFRRSYNQKKKYDFGDVLQLLR